MWIETLPQYRSVDYCQIQYTNVVLQYIIILINGNLPIELIDSACATVKTLVSPLELKEYQFIAIALGTGLCVCCLLLLCTCISFITALWK